MVISRNIIRSGYLANSTWLPLREIPEGSCYRGLRFLCIAAVEDSIHWTYNMLQLQIQVGNVINRSLDEKPKSA
jgi:hypothetical protein